MPRVPLTWLAEHVDLPEGAATSPAGAQAVAAALVRVGLEEEAIHGSQVTGPLVVGRVLTAVAEPQKNGKTIQWCTVDVGPHGVDGGPRGIVCGAHNFGEGDLVVVALPGAVLPGPFPIAARKTYGHVSDGMICSERELGLGEDHSGIIVLTRSGFDAEDLIPGQDAIALLGLGEQTVEINVTPDRGYCFSVRGVAREYSHATGAAFRDPAAIEVPVATDDGPVVQIADDAPIRGVAGCDRFVARVVRGVTAAAPSPAWMQRRLAQAGMRPISLAVDVTNYVMLELGQPLHAYDAAKVAGPVVVRRARPGEHLVTLDDVDRALDGEDLLITDSPDGAGSAHGHGSRVLGLAGVMGGADTEVTVTTTDLLIEGAHFDPVSVARSARRHKLASEASRRFERGVDPALAPAAVQRVVELLLAHGGGQVDLAVTDVDHRSPTEPVRLPADLPARVVGVDYTAAQVRQTLEQLGSGVAEDGGDLVVTVPSWRPDLTAPVDLVEEVARLRGYDRIPSVLPVAPAGRGLTPGQRARRSVARALAELGLVEVLSYPFVGSVHDDFGYPPDDERRRALRLANPLSEEAPAMRTSVLDTLVDTARRNVGRGATDLAVFEIGLVTRPGSAPQPAGSPEVTSRPDDAELAKLYAAVPPQPRHVAGVLTGAAELPGVWGPGRQADHADAVEAALLVGRTIGVDLAVRADDVAPWHPGRCAAVVLAADGDAGAVVGHAGELHPAVCERLGLPPRTVAFEVDLDAVLAAAPDGPVPARPISTFPLAKEDVALVVDAAVPAAEVLAAVRDGVGPLAEDVRLFDVYAGEQVGEGKKSLAFSLRLRAEDRTLTAQESAAAREAAVAEAHRRVGAVLRS